MKKFLFIFIIFALFLVSCTKTNEPDKTPEGDDPKIDDGEDMKDPVDLTIFTVNDFHGVIFEKGDYAGISKMATFLYNNSDENTVLISAGDMFQGTALSSMTRGRAVVDCMNYMGFDSMTIGNHEFDWGIEEINKYRDGNKENGEAEFPIICANVMDKSTGKLASWSQPYAVIERLGIKIGIIGIIGTGQENDILASKVAQYKFTDEMTAIQENARLLRVKERCQIVIVAAHCDTTYLNDSIISLSGNDRVDAIINGHTHSPYYGVTERKDGTRVPYIQSGCYGTYVGRIDITYDPQQGKVTKANANNIKILSTGVSESSGINDLLVQYQDYIDLANSDLAVSTSYIDKYTFGPWIAEQIRKKYNCDLGLINTGGVRANGFPIQENQVIKYDNVFQILPFENQLEIVYLTGKQVISLLNESNYFFLSEGAGPGNYLNGQIIDRDKLYKVVTVDYVFEKENYPFLDGQNHESTGDLVREVIADIIKNSENGKFTIR